MCDLYIGTCGYDFPEWRGVFYPENLPREEYLSFYSEHFNALELYYTYHMIPTAEEFFSLRKRSMGKLKFSLIANKALTNEIKVSEWRSITREFLKSLYPLVNEGLLLGITFLFPPTFTYEDDNRRYLANLLNEFNGVPAFIEFQHQGWFTKRVYEELERRGIGLCLCDKPSLSRLPSYVKTSSRNTILSENAYIRLLNKTSCEINLVDPIQEMSSRSKSIHIFMCNHANNASVISALPFAKNYLLLS